MERLRSRWTPKQRYGRPRGFPMVRSGRRPWRRTPPGASRQEHEPAYVRAAAGRRVDGDPAVDGLHPVAHVAQATVELADRWVEAGAVVADLEAQRMLRRPEDDADLGGALGVLDRVLDRLDAREVDRGLDLGRIAPHGAHLDA